MNDFRFASPSYLLFLLALPLLWLALRRIDSRAKERLRKFMAEENLRKLVVSKGELRERGKKLAFWLGLACCCLALARPQANPVEEEMQSAGLDIYVLLDVSKSMDAEDVAPSRLKKAKREIQHLTSRLSGDRVGLIVYANSAVLVSPLTSDYTILDSYLQHIDTGMVPSQGTNLGHALEIAREAMERGARASSTGNSEMRSNVFLVMSDGEDWGESNLNVVDTIHSSGGIIFTIALGTQKGVPIPMRNEKGELMGYKHDRLGNTVVTAVNPAVLQDVANRGGGQFYFSTLEEGEIEDILARVGSMERRSYTAIRTKVYEEFFVPVLLTGIFLLLFSFLSVTEFFLRLKALLPGKAAPLLLLVLLPSHAHANPLSFLWSREKRASEKSADLARQGKAGDAVDTLKELQAENPDSPELNYDIGTYFLIDKKNGQGRDQLKRIRDPKNPMRGRALFNLAGSYALEGNKDDARAAYADLMHDLSSKPKLSKDEKELAQLVRKNLARLADPNQQPQSAQNQQSQQQNQGGGQDQKNKQDQGQGQNKNQDSKQDQDKKQDQNKKQDQGSGQDDKKKQEQDKQKEGEKQDQQGEQKKDQDQNGKQSGQSGQQDHLPPRRGGAPFRERDNMAEDDAKRILGALREQESSLQKKFLNNKAKKGKIEQDDAAKDW
jgi:Ca-activated chloride channel homolog